MPVNNSDISIAVNGDIRYTGAAHGVTGAAYYTVIELHRWLQDKADDAVASGNDLLDITDLTPSERSTDNIITLINGYNIDDTLAEHLYDGSIIQDSGNVIYDGIVVIANKGMDLQIQQNGAMIANDFWNTIPFGDTFKGLNRDTAQGYSHRFMLKVRTTGADINGRRIIGQTREWGKTFSEFPINGTSRGNNVMALTFADDLNNVTASGTVATWTAIANLNSQYNGIDVDNNGSDEYYYSEWNKDSFSINQFYERMKYLTRTGTAETLYGVSGEVFRGITHEVNLTTPRSGTFSGNETVSWGAGATAGTGRMFAIDSTTVGTKMWLQLLTGVAPSASVTITGGTSLATATNTGTPTERTLSQPFCGVSTGSSIIASYGFGIEATDLSSNDKVFDLTNTQRQAPNYVTFSVGGVASGEDYVLVGPQGFTFQYDAEASGPFVVGETLTFTSPAGTAVLAALVDQGTTGLMIMGPMVTGSVPVDNSTISGGTSSATAAVNGAVSSTINLRQMTVNTSLTTNNITSVVSSIAIPTDTPTTGFIRVADNVGIYRKLHYTSYTGSTFTIDTVDGNEDFGTVNATAGNNMFISYIDTLADASTEAFTSVFLSTRALHIKVRDGGTAGDLLPIKTFESAGSLGSAGGSATAIRTSDA